MRQYSTVQYSKSNRGDVENKKGQTDRDIRMDGWMDEFYDMI